MAEYISKVYQMKGPKISVVFSIAKEKIVDISLELSDKDEMFVQIQGDKKCILLEKDIIHWMTAYSKKKDSKINLPLDLSGLPPYTFLVLQHIAKIPFGKSLSYKEVAEKSGKPKAARAVGNACGYNRFSLVIPCHRVLANNGKIGGYLGGLDIKSTLLEFEKS